MCHTLYMSTKNIIIVLLIALATANPVKDSSAVVDKQYAAIKKLQPKIAHKDAVKLAHALRSAAHTCNAPWEILLSIAFNESSLNKKSVNKKTMDFGLYQISITMIRKLQLDVYKVLDDEKYALSAACEIINYNKKAYGSKYPFWIGIYRSGTALWKTNIRQNAISYDNMIKKTAHKIGYIENVESYQARRD